MKRVFPFPLPDGWFQLAYSDEVARGASLRARYFGEELVLTRSDAGEARALDAAGRAWPLVERAGLVWVWRHAAGAPPSWSVPIIDEAESGEGTPDPRHRWQICTRHQENGAKPGEPPHLRYVPG